jgi:hypothetical protein
MKVNSFLLALCGALVCCSRSSEQATSPPFDCTANALPGIVLTTVDSVSGSPIPTAAVVLVQDGAYTDRAIAIPPQYYAAFERPGSYQVTATLVGYQTWKATNIVVRNGQCHVETVGITARLVH